jgi:hypothetical protein
MSAVSAGRLVLRPLAALVLGCGALILVSFVLIGDSVVFRSLRAPVCALGRG